MERPFPAYKGDELYVFVSYAHEDDALVYPEIQWLKDQSFNIWYGEGISARKLSFWDPVRALNPTRLAYCYLALPWLFQSHSFALTTQTIRHFVTTIFWMLLAVSPAACSSTGLVSEPQALTLERPLMISSDLRLEAYLDWVIVPDGAGTWAEDAFWDEYLLRVRNVSERPIRITEVVIYDSLDTCIESVARLKNLRSESRRTERRYDGEGIDVVADAGIGAAAFQVAGMTSYGVGAGTAFSVLSGSATVSATAAGAAVAALVAAPVLLIVAASNSKDEHSVAREMITRNTPLPVDLSTGELKSLHIFFPLAPSPRRIELSYSDSGGTHKLVIDTGDVLQGLHIDSARDAPQ